MILQLYDSVQTSINDPRFCSYVVRFYYISNVVCAQQLQTF